MILIYGNASVGQAQARLLSLVWSDHHVVDYTTYYPDLCDQATVILASPGIPPSHDIYREHSHKIMNEITFLGAWQQWLIDGMPVWPFDLINIGITWTKGKSSTVHLTTSLLQSISPFPVYAVGNIWHPWSDILADIIEKKHTDQLHILVREVSSFMLRHMKYWSFDYSLWTNLSPDHLNWHADMDDYAHAKAELPRHTSQKAFVPSHLQHYIQRDTPNNQDKKQHITEPQTTLIPDIETDRLSYVWNHHMTNIAMVRDMVSQIAHDRGRYDLPRLLAWLYKTQPLPHRMHRIYNHQWVDRIDDGFSTNTLAQEHALRSFDHKVILIAGWSDKGESYDHLSHVYQDHVHTLICMGHIGPNIEKIALHVWVETVYVPSLRQAVIVAWRIAQQNKISTVLFSPWAASFDMFTNAKQRAELFCQEVMRYTSKSDTEE